ncbi:MAG: hypothetical protein E7508_02240 [Ruminococcus sp.]|nr:hypothetical protein [Ruminococcus sp.]
MLIIISENSDSGNLEVIGTESVDENTLDIISENEKIKNLIEEKGEKIVELKDLRSWIYDIFLIYIKTNVNEYIVPYFYGLTEEAIAGRIESEKLYEVTDFITAMNNTYDIESINNPYNRYLVGGAIEFKPLNIDVADTIENNLNESKMIFIILTIVTAFIFILVTVLSIIFRNKHKKH